MYHGAQQTKREHLLAQAQLITVALFGGAGKEELETYLRTGLLRTSDDDAENVIPYDGDAMRQAVINANGGLGELRD